LANIELLGLGSKRLPLTAFRAFGTIGCIGSYIIAYGFDFFQ